MDSVPAPISEDGTLFFHRRLADSVGQLMVLRDGLEVRLAPMEHVGGMAFSRSASVGVATAREEGQWGVYQIFVDRAPKLLSRMNVRRV